MIDVQTKDEPEQLTTSAPKSADETPRALSFDMKVKQNTNQKYDFIAARTSMVKINIIGLQGVRWAITPIVNIPATRTKRFASTFIIRAATDWNSLPALVEATVHLVKVCLGSGFMSMHEGYAGCGIWTALGLNVALGLSVTYCMCTLASSAQMLYARVCLPIMTYPDLLEASVKIGPWVQVRKYSLYFRYSLDFILALGLFCSCCVYQIVIARSLKQLAEGSDVLVDGGNSPTRTYILSLMFPCLLICMITSLKYLTPFIVVADLLIISLAVTTTYYGATISATSVVNLPGFVSISGLFQFLGLCLFSLDGFGAVMAIENHMAEPKKFPIVLFTGMSFVITVVIMNGFFGCWGFGDKGQSPITINYPWRPFPIMLKVFITLMIYVSFALNFWIPFELVWYYLKLRHAPVQCWFWERIYRALFVVMITLVAYGLPNVVYFSGLIGSICVSNTGFVYPAFIELLVNWKEPGLGVLRWRLWKCIFFMILGLLLCCGGAYVNGIRLIEAVLYKDSTVRI